MRTQVDIFPGPNRSNISPLQESLRDEVSSSNNRVGHSFMMWSIVCYLQPQSQAEESANPQIYIRNSHWSCIVRNGLITSICIDVVGVHVVKHLARFPLIGRLWVDIRFTMTQSMIMTVAEMIHTSSLMTL
jgi:hypothetical protein